MKVACNSPHSRKQVVVDSDIVLLNAAIAEKHQMKKAAAATAAAEKAAAKEVATKDAAVEKAAGVGVSQLDPTVDTVEQKKAAKEVRPKSSTPFTPPDGHGSIC